MVFLRNAMSLRVKYSVICLLKSINDLIFTMAMTMKNCQTCLMFRFSFKYICTNRYSKVRTAKQTVEQQTDTRTNRRTDGRTNRCMDRQTLQLCIYLNLSSLRAETNSSDFKEINLIKKYTKLKQALNRALK